MKKLVFAVALIGGSISAFAEAAPAPAKDPEAAQTEAKAKAAAKDAKDTPRALRRDAGRVAKPNSAKGCIVFLDVGNQIPDKDYNRIIGDIRSEFRFVFKVVRKDSLKEYGEGDAAIEAAKKALAADVLVVVASDPSRGTMLANPEDGWAYVNAAKMDRSLPNQAAKDRIVPQRLCKETLRALAYACGAGGTTFPGNTLAIAKLEDLDYCKEFIPFDALQQMAKLLAVRGVKPELYLSYLSACKQGWAPAPTNDAQRALWKRVHEMPSEPIKIKYDPKKGE